MLEALDLVKAAPVIFQELVPGEDVRVTVVDDRVVSAVVVETRRGRSTSGLTRPTRLAAARTGR